MHARARVEPAQRGEAWKHFPQRVRVASAPALLGLRR